MKMSVFVPKAQIYFNNVIDRTSYPGTIRSRISFSIKLPGAQKKMLINDTRRSPLAYAGYAVFSRLFLHKSLAAYDNPLSIVYIKQPGNPPIILFLLLKKPFHYKREW
jgi:hypothetical protein